MVLSRRAAHGTVVAALSPLAAAWGVQLGMPVAEAAALVQRQQRAATSNRPTGHQKTFSARPIHSETKALTTSASSSTVAKPTRAPRDSSPSSSANQTKAYFAPDRPLPAETVQTVPAPLEQAHPEPHPALARIAQQPVNSQSASQSVRPAQSSAGATRVALDVRPVRPTRNPTTHDSTSCWHEAPLDMQADREALAKLAQWCCRFSPLVGLEESSQPDTLLFDLTGVAPLFGGEKALLEQVQRTFNKLRLEIRLGLGETIGAAWALAHFGETYDAPLPSLPVAALRLPENTVSILQQLGLNQIGDLALLPRGEVQTRLGSLLLQRLDQAWGQRPELLQPVSPPSDFTVQWSFEYPVHHREPLEAACGQLVERICFLLQQKQRGALQVRCQLECQSGPPVVIQFGLFQPSACSRHLLQLLDLQFQHRPFPDDVVQITLQVGQHGPLRWQQLELFDTAPQPDDTQQIAALIDRLTSRLGRDSVLQCKLQADPQPERKTQLTPYHAIRTEPARATRGRRKSSATLTTTTSLAHPNSGSLAALGDRSSRKSSTSVLDPHQTETSATFLQAAPPRTTCLDSPLHLLLQPLALQVLAVAPDGPPLRFEYRGKQQHIVSHWGPERIETGWWRRPGIRRDYYRVETTSGSHFWLFRCLQSGTWFLHGSF